jgi:D-glycero-D-manno-heptose 1,7-bisphosphate phosphatase
MEQRMTTTAIFLDRDGTIIEDAPYIGDPEAVRLLPGAAEAIRRFTELGHLVVVISNQSGIARGLFDEEDLARVHRRLEALLDQQGARLDGAYYCPYIDGPEAVVEAYRRKSELRKPRPGMLLQAADELGIDLPQSWMIGNAMRDVEAGIAAGCRTILIADPSIDENDLPGDTPIAPSLLDAVAIVERVDQYPDSQSVHGTAQRSRKSAGSATEVHTSQTSPLSPRRSRSEGLPQRKQLENDEMSFDHSSETVRLLTEISDQLDRFQRQTRQHDFSVLRLFGALLQMFAVVVGVWGAFALLNDQHDPATARFAFACFLQLAAISTFAIDRFR